MGWFSPSFNTCESSRCFYDKLKGTCGACKILNEKDYVSGWCSGYKYRCERIGSYLPWDGKACSRIDEIDPGKVDCVDRYYKLSGRKYFILTAIFEILGFDMNKCLYTEIQAMIELVREDASTKAEAIEYDIVGMDIANQLRKDPNRVELCNYLLHNYVVEIYKLIETNKVEEAINLYKEMVKKLFIYYNNKERYANIIDANVFTKIKTI